MKFIRENTTANAPLITNNVLFPRGGPWSLIRLNILPKYIFLNLVMSFAVQLVSDFMSTPYVLRQQRGIIQLVLNFVFSTARFRLCVHTLRFETATWNQSNSPTCDLCDTDDVQDEQHVLFHCANPHIISFRRNMHLCFPQQEPTMCLLS